MWCYMDLSEHWRCRALFARPHEWTHSARMENVMAQSYKKIEPRIWDDEQFDQLADPAEALAAFFLLTGKWTNRAGVAVFSEGLAADKLRINPDKLWDIMSRVCTTMCWPIQKTGRSTIVVLFPKWFKSNPPKNQDHLKGCLSDLHDVPNCEIIQKHYLQLAQELREEWRQLVSQALDKLSRLCPASPRHTLDIGNGSGSGSGNGNDNGSGSGSGNKKAPSALDDPPPADTGGKKKTTAKKTVYSDDFEKFWGKYPPKRRKDKKKAFVAWEKAIVDKPPDVIIAAVEEYAESDVGCGEFVQGPVPWLNGGCWDDDRRAWQNNHQSKTTLTNEVAIREFAAGGDSF